MRLHARSPGLPLRRRADALASRGRRRAASRSPETPHSHARARATGHRRRVAACPCRHPAPRPAPGHLLLALSRLGRPGLGARVRPARAVAPWPGRLRAPPLAARREPGSQLLPAAERQPVRELCRPGAGRLPLRGQGAEPGRRRAGAGRGWAGHAAESRLSRPHPGRRAVRRASHRRAGNAHRRTGVPAEPPARRLPRPHAGTAGPPVGHAARPAPAQARGARRRGGGGSAQSRMADARLRRRAARCRCDLLPGPASQAAAHRRADSAAAGAVARPAGVPLEPEPQARRLRLRGSQGPV